MNNSNFKPVANLNSLISRILLATGIITIIVLIFRMIDASSKKDRQSYTEKQ
jgi:hypothetical protein